VQLAVDAGALLMSAVIMLVLLYGIFVLQEKPPT
jgi:hypothetical protein